jgi:hypothetical protein
MADEAPRHAAVNDLTGILRAAGAAPLTFSLETGPADAPCRLILAHGAGAPPTSSFLESVAKLLGSRGLPVTRIEFAYMAGRRMGGPKRPPPRAESLTSEFKDAVEEFSSHRSQRLIIGGKSLGGRVASLVAQELYDARGIAGLVCLGYPFHPPNKPQQWRTAHLETLSVPTLIVQGERDPFGARAEVERLKLSPNISFVWIGDGDHDLGPRGASGFTRKGNLATAADAVAAFAAKLMAVR